MSFKATKIVLRDVRVGSPTAKLVLAVLADHVRASGSEPEAWPSVRTLIERSELSRSSVYAALALLEEKGFLKKESRFDSSGRQKSNVYRLRLPATELEDDRGRVREPDSSRAETEELSRFWTLGGPDSGPLEHITGSEKTTGREKLELEGIPSEETEIGRVEAEVLEIFDQERRSLMKVVRSRWPDSVGQKDLRKRIREHPRHRTPHFWRGFFQAAASNPTYNGENSRGWRAGLAWLVKRANFDKVVEQWANAVE